ncbi:MAG: PIN domain-containing protein [bacterium]
MRVVVDTNVVISGLFFWGWPYRVLEGWRDGRVEIVVSGAILEEYWGVAQRLSEEYPGVNAEPFLEMLSGLAEVVDAPGLPAPCARTRMMTSF